ncbi:hypothetical protein LAZ67_3003959 [Cordylochernes scorpioides]|uniref:Reverse transcriptase domain-containing protein n=1 Tax=Cordylochernes scorpioides TaxID=51811 RepID=A0ABY6KC65_9ARAC|nr:hypothetical protein LAZ67_3003959 [Cordylochernes scorpioides]
MLMPQIGKEAGTHPRSLKNEEAGRWRTVIKKLQSAPAQKSNLSSARRAGEAAQVRDCPVGRSTVSMASEANHASNMPGRDNDLPKVKRTARETSQEEFVLEEVINRENQVKVLANDPTEGRLPGIDRRLVTGTSPANHRERVATGHTSDLEAVVGFCAAWGIGAPSILPFCGQRELMDCTNEGISLMAEDCGLAFTQGPCPRCLKYRPPATPDIPRIISVVEPAISSLSHTAQYDIRSSIAHILRKPTPTQSQSPSQSQSLGKYRSLATLRRNHNIIITRSDKGSQTVVLDTADYASKMTEILNDRNTFVPITQPDASTSTKSFRLGLLRLKKSGHITPDQYSTFTSDLNNTPYIYGLPKTHKPGIPLRPIIAYHLSPAYKLSKYLTGLLTPWVKASPQSSAIREIPSFVQSINSLCPVPNTVMVSYDVVAMYLSLPHQLIIRHLTSFLQDNQVDHRTAESIVALSSLCLDFTTFTFNNQLFKQIRGSPMGSPLSSPLAEIVMANIDHWVQQQIAPGIHMWRRYIDDIFCICDTGQEINILNSLNSYHPEISFTLELENRSVLPYLDILVIRTASHYHTTVYHKINNPTFYTDYKSSFAISRILRTHGVNTHFTNSNSIGAILRHPITRLPRSTVARSSGGSVYSVSCNDCSASYIGETAFDRVWREKLRDKLHNIGSVLSLRSSPCLPDAPIKDASKWNLYLLISPLAQLCRLPPRLHGRVDIEEELPEGAWLVLYADDQFLIIEAASRARAEKCVEASLQILSNWAHDSGLKFNVSKTKALSFKPRDIRTKRKGIKWEHKPAIQMKGRRVALVNRMTILGVVIDDKMGWQYQAEEMVTRGREALDQKVAKTLESVQRTAALRITGGYRTTSSEAFLVLAGLIPLGLKLEEETIRQKIWENREDALRLEAGALEWKRDPRKPPQWLPKWNWSPGGPTGIDTEVFTDGNKSGTNTGAGVVIFTNGELIFQESLTLRVDELVFSAELVAIRVALRVCAEKNFSPDRLYSDCMSALVAIDLVKGQLAHQIIQELKMITRAPEGREKEGRGAIESKLLRNHSKLLEKAHDVASELFLN